MCCNFERKITNAMAAFRSYGWAFFGLVVLIICGCIGLQKADAKNIVVGGKEGWHYGFNYTDWISKIGPIHVNDTLVFKYAAPGRNTFPHDVCLLKNKNTFKDCSMEGARLLAGAIKGGGKTGFRYRLSKPKPYFFACGMGNGSHCENGFMKFYVKPCFKYHL